MQNHQDHSHEKNLDNFKTLRLYILSLGAVYNPFNDELSPASIDALIKEGQELFEVLNHIGTLNSKMIDRRETAFKPLPPLFTQVKNALAISKAGAKALESFETINRKMQGGRATPKEAGENSISVSQKGFDSRLAQLQTGTAFLNNTPEYNPHEAHLKVPALKNLHADLTLKNDNAKITAMCLSSQITRRNMSLYAPDSGLVDIALKIISYVQSTLGTKSIDYQRIRTLKFKNRIKIEPQTLTDYLNRQAALSPMVMLQGLKEDNGAPMQILVEPV